MDIGKNGAKRILQATIVWLAIAAIMFLVL